MISGSDPSPGPNEGLWKLGRSPASGVADVRGWWDDEIGKFRIEVRVHNRLFGPVFGYRGAFTVVERPCAPGDIPLDVRPLREERRE